MSLCARSTRILRRLAAAKPRVPSIPQTTLANPFCRPRSRLFRHVPVPRYSTAGQTRSLSTMDSKSDEGVSNEFTQAVVGAMKSLYPEELADRAWDNVGLLLENFAEDPSCPRKPVVLLTNDLTPRVADEAIKKGASVIVSYHPPIFRGLKSITLADKQQQFLLKLVQLNIAVYSPHTALDAAVGGISDWLLNSVLPPNVSVTSRVPAKPVAGPLPEGYNGEGAGYGRVCTLADPQPLPVLLRELARNTGGRKYISVAYDRTTTTPLEAREVRTIGVCAGSGADVLRGCDADLYVTGEMSHHEALAAVMKGKVVATLFHSNSERGFLRAALKGQLEAELKRTHPDVEVLVSEKDGDPFEIVDVAQLLKAV